MTWGEFKAQIESMGVGDGDIVVAIDWVAVISNYVVVLRNGAGEVEIFND